MSLLRDMARAAKERLGKIRGDKVRIGDKNLSKLTDEELEDELVRRRRMRAGGASPPVSRPRRKVRRETPEARRLRQYYVNLELDPQTPLPEIKAHYRELMRRYHPDKHSGDQEKHKAATELSQELTRAYHAIVASREAD